MVRVYYGDDLYIRSPSRAHRPHRAHKTRTTPQSQTTTHADDTLTYSKDDNKTSETSRNTLAADRAHSESSDLDGRLGGRVGGVHRDGSRWTGEK